MEGIVVCNGVPHIPPSGMCRLVFCVRNLPRTLRKESMAGAPKNDDAGSTSPGKRPSKCHKKIAPPLGVRERRITPGHRGRQCSEKAGAFQRPWVYTAKRALSVVHDGKQVDVIWAQLHIVCLRCMEKITPATTPNESSCDEVALIIAQIMILLICGILPHP